MTEEDIIVNNVARGNTEPEGSEEDLESFYKAREEYEEWLEKLDSRKQEEYFEGTN